MSKLSLLKEILKNFGFFVVVIFFSFYTAFSSDSSDDEKAADVGDSPRLSMTDVAEQLEDVDDDVSFETLRQKRLKIWNEKLPERARAWGMSEAEYLERASQYISYFKKSTHTQYGVEDLIPRYLPDDLEAYNKVWKHTGKTYTRDSFSMFGLPARK
ncbi:MAG: hypothetical protein K2Q34_06935 [Alphaproteobacteria bacterium]|nr:hypothetical protein [Alphaproteobacteria bacterium]